MKAPEKNIDIPLTSDRWNFCWFINGNYLCWLHVLS